ncbi:hypothetical protein [Glycomyces sp. NRRL B-16210]|uniref:hypothetical protein n=1 Tax=Glycomyces sp. NRRL B-16210 TaxID=1463821 RepID=UPI0004C146EE|nr:hypothetical protein [Glycomyces sp. NRRL B-16210]
MVQNASGRRYRVVEVDETEAAEFADPPRTWGRVGAMVAGWAIVLAVGAWVAPGFAAGSSDQDQDSRDEPATDAVGAALRYLRNGSDEDLKRAEDALCDDADPELSAEGLDEIRQSYVDSLGGITRIDLKPDDPVGVADGVVIPVTVFYISKDTQRDEDFIVTVRQEGEAFCVANAVRVQDEEPSSGETSAEAVDPKVVANDFLRLIVVENNAAAAALLECSPAPELGAQDLEAAIEEWANRNTTADGSAKGFINSLDAAESAESSITVFSAEVSLRGDLENETVTFEVGVQGDCIASLANEDGFFDR